MFGSLVILLLMGLPLAFVTGGLGVVALFVFGDIHMVNMLPSRVFPFMTDYLFGASIFVGFYIVNGGQEFVTASLLGTGLGPYGILLIMMILLIILGMFLDWVGILLLAVPIFAPIMRSLPWDGLLGLPGVAPDDVNLWFGVVYMVNMQMSFLSPPFGYALFYLKSVAPPEITIGLIFKSAIPFLILQAVGLALVILFPEIILWLPRLVYG